MTLVEAARDIESHQFAARVNVASAVPDFVRAIEREASVKILVRYLREQPHTVQFLITKMRRIREMDFDVQYENPRDAAMAAYGWALATTKPALKGLVADLLASLANSWWSGQLAGRYRSIPKEREDAGLRYFLASSRSTPSVVTVTDVSTRAIHSGLGALSELEKFRFSIGHVVVLYVSTEGAALSVFGETPKFFDSARMVPYKQSSATAEKKVEFLQ